MNNLIQDQLKSLADEDYRRFSAALIPNINNVLGIRLPLLRKLAKQLARENWRTYLEEAGHEYFEEVMLQGMVIGYIKADMNELLPLVAAFVPKIDNWSVCDSFCISLKFVNKDKGRVWNFLRPYLESEQEYEIRFAIVILLNYYIEEEYIQQVLSSIDQIEHNGYYVKMAAAWAISICYIKFPETTELYLANNSLDDFTYNKTLQKITESYRVDPVTKTRIRAMKRKPLKSV